MLDQTLVSTSQTLGRPKTERARPLYPTVAAPSFRHVALRRTTKILQEVARTAADIYIVGAALLALPLMQLRRQIFPWLRTGADIRAAVGYTRILGTIPSMPRRRTLIGKAMSAHLDPRGRVANAHRAVARTILKSPGKHRTILITSARAGDGKSVCATNLAVVLAQSGRSVLLIDGNLRQPAQHVHMDLKGSHGTIDALRSPAALRWAIQPSGINRLDVLAAGIVHEDPSELFAMGECRALLVDLTLRYDHVIIDSPALNTCNDAALLAGHCDTTVLVVRAGKTTRDEAARAMSMLKDGAACVVGAMINAGRTRKASTCRRPTIADWQPSPPPTPPVPKEKSSRLQRA